jgi:plastocyanin
VGQPITPAVLVSVLDAAGTPITGGDYPITLTLALHPSGATLRGTTTVNAQGGVATFSDVHISKPGSGFVLSASTPGLTSAISSGFDVSAAPGVATTVAPVAGQGQTAAVGQSVAINPSVRVTDGLGNPVANISVTFAVSSGGGNATGLSQTTDGGGLATVGQWTLGTRPGVNTLVAASPDVEGSLATFRATATVAAAAELLKHGGDEQIARAGTQVPLAPSVEVRDAYGNPVAGVLVTFSVISGGGTITDASQRTDSNGVAAVGSWTLGHSEGRNTLRAASTGLTGSPATFTATAFMASLVIEARNDYFRSTKNGSGGPENFGPPAVDTIRVGGTVIWQWEGSNHDVTPRTPPNWPVTGSGTHSAPFIYGPVTFNRAGTYRYNCTNHSKVVPYLGLVGMRGEIVVR